MIALHKKFSVTVRRIFSDDPAAKTQAVFEASAVFPFLFHGCLGLVKKY